MNITEAKMNLGSKEQKEIRESLRYSVENFRLPRYSELPRMGLYLEQVVKYINEFLSTVGCAEITTSMVSNYVKKGIIPSPVKKQYYADQIAYLIFIAFIKNVISLENILELFSMQKRGFSMAMAYDYFCAEYENMLFFVFGLKDRPDENLGVTQAGEKEFLRYVIISATNSVYISAYFAELKKERQIIGEI